MSSTIFFLGDTHFGHKNIINFSAATRPYSTIEEHNEALVEKWNAVVKPKDVVWLLGDVAFGRENLRYVRYLNGTKHLVMGNHDTYSIMDYIEVGFIKICGVINYNGFLLSHVPIHPSQLEFRWKWNVHGHIHDPAKYRLSDQYINVNCDVVNCTPVSLEELQSITKVRELRRQTNSWYEEEGC